MMTSSMTSITVSNPHNPAKKTDVFRKKHLRIGISCVSAAAYFQRQHLHISRDSICVFPETEFVFRVVMPPVAHFQESSKVWHLFTWPEQLYKSRCLSVGLSICWSVNLLVCQSVGLSICWSVNLLVEQSVVLFVCLSVCQ